MKYVTIFFICNCSKRYVYKVKIVANYLYVDSTCKSKMNENKSTR